MHTIIPASKGNYRKSALNSSSLSYSGPETLEREAHKYKVVPTTKRTVDRTHDLRNAFSVRTGLTY